VEPVRPPGHPDKDKIKQPDSPTLPKAQKAKMPKEGSQNLSKVMKFEAFAQAVAAPARPTPPKPPARKSLSVTPKVDEQDVAERFIRDMAKKGLSVKKLMKGK
jgi:hypothetical protein